MSAFHILILTAPAFKAELARSLAVLADHGATDADMKAEAERLGREWSETCASIAEGPSYD